MTSLPKEWRFLRAAWIYALVLSGNEASATEMVSKALGDVSARNDLVSSKRRRRLFFSILYREGQKCPQHTEADKNLPPGLAGLHGIPEPSRSALALLHLRLFDADQIAVIIGKTEKELPEILASARGEFSKSISDQP